jgi:NAD(P)-dependent dehydrogenase (short-subunit alcohol dehydrogenase family)
MQLAEKAALITGGSGGIGLAIARALGAEDYALTISARRPEKLEQAADGLRAEGLEVQHVPANMTSEEEIVSLVAAHRKRYGRMDVLANNAGIGIGQPMAEITTKYLDMQLGVNLRAVVIATRESLPLLRQAGAEHGKALIANTASVAGKSGQAWLSVYSATKHAVVGFSQSTQKEVADDGVQVTALCPGFVDTAMTEFVREQVKPEEMIQPEDIGEAMRFLLRTSRYCVVPEIIFLRPSEAAGAGVP